MRYEVKIDILDARYINSLVVALARQGYAPYYNADEGDKGVVCFSG